MCGINGIISNTNKDKESLKNHLAKMNQLIFHRGPDEDGFYIDASESASVAMAMRRLSIIDLSTGKQPMYTDNNQIGIVFNGEIYNYRILKQQLENSGVTFKTTSDTEVILKLYEQKGVDAFKELDGMFAFSIHDKIKNKVFIARDFFGEKPLYYTKTKTDFIYGSELKSIVSCLPSKPNICKEGINLYFRLTYIPAPYSIYEDIHKLPSNHYIDYDLSSDTFSIHEIEKQKPIEKIDISFDAAKKEVYNKVMESVESRSIADVSLGTFLSGGVDSSVVTHCLAEISDEKIETFSIGFEKKTYDETDKSQVVAKLVNSNHHEFIVKEEDFKNGIDNILLNFDEPFADSSALPTYLVSKHASDYVKVALTGDGGDEVFGGYNKYYMGKLNNKYTSVVPKGLHKQILKLSNGLLNTKDDNRGKRFKLNRLLKAFNYDGNQYWNIISLAFTDYEKTQLLKDNSLIEDTFAEFKSRLNQHKPKNLTDFRMVDKDVSLEGDMLVKVDRTSMLSSLECRAPFLNKAIWDLTNSLPENYLMKGWNKKYILKEAFADKFSPGFLDKSKQGFGVPVGDWLRGSLKAELESYVEPKFIESQNLFNIDFVSDLVKKHISGKEDKSMQVWCFYTFQKWYLNTYLMLK
ncbi:asparagine synthase (glutamine-hydrolyzing) [Winogradskyella echinorum]|uniref:asparagine synthase (glutamine-hydrolyzing) n=1 Tax=Winogradskyella echinorum TaxID=538189 RepID=A0ABR6Y0F7_9FLAO|nr:asparagine synthase (glutamine-hydrolyzing) [Winogradskyella echinorum]MBC3846217.1 asparagine synthase (glutamine-hydrolyzing) [Winogradskyella echinorum]MBC5750565.1 asparagine synthase (glutamine-hydrolyzing) [Winogradskyella echinorum]